MNIMAIDLGTTNIKVASYSPSLEPVALESHTVAYRRDGVFVEFDAEAYFDTVAALMAACSRNSRAVLGDAPYHVVLTGQAESLVVLGAGGKPARNGISWLDMRSRAECGELAERLDIAACYRTTGQPEIIPTWPLTKILWIRKNEPGVFSSATKYLLIKDYILYRLTGRFVGEHSVYPFSCYFDILNKRYWDEALDAVGITAERLPDPVPPCSVVGDILPDVLSAAGLGRGSVANAGTLDHFAGMIGTGNIMEGMVSESAGTVSSIATFAREPFATEAKIPLYCGPFPDSYIYLPVCESGGISLEWFKNAFAADLSFRELDEKCAERNNADSRLVFLPYLTGVNPPEFDAAATGVFYGVGVGHDRYDLSLAILYGVACLLRKNVDFFIKAGIRVDAVLSTGGGAKSALWSQIKADICGRPVVVPENHEAPCLGAAIIGAVVSGAFPDYPSAIGKSVRRAREYTPSPDRGRFEEKYRAFLSVYDRLFG